MILLTVVFLEPLVSGSLLFGDLVSPDVQLIWTLLGDDFRVCFRIQLSSVRQSTGLQEDDFGKMFVHPALLARQWMHARASVYEAFAAVQNIFYVEVDEPLLGVCLA